MKKNILIIIVLFAFASCNNVEKISLTKLTGSPTYDQAKLRLNDFNENEKNEFSFEVDNYELVSKHKMILNISLQILPKDNIFIL